MGKLVALGLSKLVALGLSEFVSLGGGLGKLISLGRGLSKLTSSANLSKSFSLALLCKFGSAVGNLGKDAEEAIIFWHGYFF